MSDTATEAPERERATADEKAEGMVFAVEIRGTVKNAIDMKFTSKPARAYALKQLLGLLAADARRA